MIIGTFITTVINNVLHIKRTPHESWKPMTQIEIIQYIKELQGKLKACERKTLS